MDFESLREKAQYVFEFFQWVDGEIDRNPETLPKIRECLMDLVSWVDSILTVDIGDRVRLVGPDPDMPGLKLEDYGLTGVVAYIEFEEDGPYCTVKVDDSAPEEYRQRCGEEGYAWDEIYLPMNQLVKIEEE